MQKCPSCGAQLDIRITKATDSPAPQAAPIGDLGELLDAISDGGLTGQAATFVSDVRERFEKYGDRTRMSEKQMAWLRKIADEQASGESF